MITIAEDRPVSHTPTRLGREVPLEPTHPQHSRRQKILREQVRLLYARDATVLLGTLGIASAALVVLWQPIGAVKLLPWFVGTLVITALRGWLGARFRRQETDAAKPLVWARAYCIGAFVNGLVWSVVPWFFLLPEQPLYVLFITCLYAGYVSGSVASTAVYFPAFLSFSAPITVIFALRVFLETEPIYFAIGIMILFYAAASYSFARNNNRTIEDAIRLRFENVNLMEELRDQRDAAEHALKVKNHFLATTSHDLRQPLHALGLFIEAMGSELQDNQPRDTLDKIRESTEALTAQLHGMLDLSSLDAAIVEHKPSHFSLGGLLTRLQNEFAAQVLAKGLKMTVLHEEDVAVHADAQIVERILRNLVSNAVNNTDRGTITLGVESIEGERVEITVRDTGCGIPREEHGAIFDEYHQLNNPGRDRRRGLGLGLAIVKRLCALGDYELRLDSTVGEGSAFRLTLPAGDVQKIGAPRVPASSSRLKGARVVLIDDDQDILASTSAMLTRWGCDCVVALSPESALRELAADANPPDLVVSDLRLQDNANGINAIEQLRRRYGNQLPAVLITGETLPEELRAANAVGLQVLHKPVQPGELRSALNFLLAQRPASAEQRALTRGADALGAGIDVERAKQGD